MHLYASIGFDFDDVIFDLSSLIQRKYTKYVKDWSVDFQNRPEYYIEDSEYMSSEQISKMVKNIIYNHWSDGEELDNSLKYLYKLYKIIKKPIPIITHRGLDLENVTKSWLDLKIKENGKKFKYEIFCIGRAPKLDIIKELELDYFVDDYDKNINELSEILISGFILNKSWNINKQVKSNVVRIDNLFGVYNEIKNKI